MNEWQGRPRSIHGFKNHSCSWVLPVAEGHREEWAIAVFSAAVVDVLEEPNGVLVSVDQGQGIGEGSNRKQLWAWHNVVGSSDHILQVPHTFGICDQLNFVQFKDIGNETWLIYLFILIFGHIHSHSTIVHRPAWKVSTDIYYVMCIISYTLDHNLNI